MTRLVDPAGLGGAVVALLPELFLAAWTLLVLGVVAWRHRTEEDSYLVGRLSLAGVVLAGLAYAALWLQGVRTTPDSAMVVLDDFRIAGAAIILLVAGPTILLSLRFLDRQRLLAPEYYVLVLLATLGMLAMVAAADLMVLFLGLELMSVAVYVLAGYDRFRRSSAEAALKYFLIGAFASGFLLYGIALVFGATGTTNLRLVAERLGPGPLAPMPGLGLGLLLVGFGFKVSAVPFHMWAPDVYDGAPTPVTGFMAAGVKAAGFAALARVLLEAFPAAAAAWQPVVGLLAVATIVGGNVVALAQHSLKRMLAYSSIAHAGYLLAALWAGSSVGLTALLLYLGAYCLTTVAAFGILLSIERVGSRTVLIEDLEGLFLVRPWAALSMSVCLISLLGFPGTYGFIGKWSIIAAVAAEGQVLLAVAVVLGSAISAGYYLPVIMGMTMKPTRTPQSHRQVAFSRAAKVIVAGAVIANLLFGVWPAPLVDAARDSAAAVIGAVGGGVAGR